MFLRHYPKARMIITWALTVGLTSLIISYSPPPLFKTLLKPPILLRQSLYSTEMYSPSLRTAF